MRWPTRAIGWPRRGSACPTRLQAETLRQTVLSAGVQNVEVVAEAEAAAALARSVGADAALLLADDDTVSLTVVGEDEESTSVLASVPIGAAGAAVACAAVLQQVPGPEATRIMLVGQRLDLDSIAAELRSTAPVEVPPDAGYAIARGAAQTVEDSGFPGGGGDADGASRCGRDDDGAGGWRRDADGAGGGDATQMAQAADPAAVGPQLAYSQEEPDYYEMPADSIEEFVPEQEDEAPYTAVIAPPPPRTLLMGSALAFVVMASRRWRSRSRSPSGRRRRRSAAGTGRPVGDGAGALPAAGAARAGSGGVADRGGVAAARRLRPRRVSRPTAGR